MNKINLWIMSGVMVAATLGAALPASAHRVVYTLRTVADGQIGTRVFNEAEVVITFTGDTSAIQTELNSTGGNVYTNRSGTATVTIDDGFKKTVATFNSGEVYVRFDAQYGVVGFGSAISPTYPVALGCAEPGGPVSENCANSSTQDTYEDGTSDALADVAAYPADTVAVSPAALSLPYTLSRSTLLTGSAIACAVALSYDINNNVICSSAAPTGLKTNRGALYLQDNAAALIASYQDSNGYGFANVGAMRVEVLQDD